MAFTSRHPYTTDAYELGYAIGWRQNTSGHQTDDLPNTDIPVLFLDNDFRDPDLDAYLELVDRYQPDVAIIGDATTRQDAEQYQQAANELRDTYSDVEPVIVPKCRDALEVIEQDTVLGWPKGYANIDPLDYSTLNQWRGRRIHILGGNPHDQYAVIHLLTQPTLTNDDPADIVGLDGNSVLKAAYFGEFWTPLGYKSADHLSIRETVRYSLQEIKQYWQARGVWPDTEPIDLYGPAVREPDDPVFAANGADITSQEKLEEAIVVEYDDYTLAYRSEGERNHVEYYDGLGE